MMTNLKIGLVKSIIKKVRQDYLTEHEHHLTHRQVIKENSPSRV